MEPAVLCTGREAPCLLDEVWQLILGLLRGVEPLRCASVCRQWQLWTPLCVRFVLRRFLKRATDQQLSCLRNVVKLELSRSTKSADAITDVGLCSLVNLHSLNLSHNPVITDAAVSCLTNLTHLDLRGREVQVGAALTGLTSLQGLCIRQNTRVVDTVLATLRNLTLLYLDQNLCITDAALSTLTQLQILSLVTNTLITDDGLAPLTRLSTLTLVYCPGITGRALQDKPALVDLALGDPSHRIQAPHITHLTQLSALRVSYFSLDTQTLRCLTRLTRLEIRARERVPVDALLLLTALRELQLGGSCTDAFAADMMTSHSLTTLTNLRQLSFTSNPRVDTTLLASALSPLCLLRFDAV